MLFQVYISSFVIIFICSPVSTSSYHEQQLEACDDVFDNQVGMKINCCPPMQHVVDSYAKCSNKTGSSEYTCSLAQCVIELYRVTTNNKIDDKKVRFALNKLTKDIPATKPLNEEIFKNCLNGQYKQYVTSDPDCDSMLYLNCAYINYLMGCQEFKQSPCSCEELSEDVATCKPCLKEYLKQINSDRC